MYIYMRGGNVKRFSRVGADWNLWTRKRRSREREPAWHKDCVSRARNKFYTSREKSIRGEYRDERERGCVRAKLLYIYYTLAPMQRETGFEIRTCTAGALKFVFRSFLLCTSSAMCVYIYIQGFSKLLPIISTMSVRISAIAQWDGVISLLFRQDVGENTKNKHSRNREWTYSHIASRRALI